MYNISLKFFNEYFLYESSDKNIIDRIRLIFTHFEELPNELNYSAKFRLTPNNEDKIKNYETLLTSNSNLDIEYYYTNPNDKIKWSYNDTIFPPLQIYPLKGRFMVLHGCGIKMKNNVIIFPAKSMSGKTSLITYLTSRGAKLISDDLLFIDKNTLMVYPYPKPVGIRERGLSLIPELKKIVDKLINKETLAFVNYEGYKTWLIHMEEIYKDCYIQEPVEIDNIYFIDKIKDFRIHYNKSNKDIFLKIYSELCNSGLNTFEKSQLVWKIMGKVKKIGFLSTFNLENAYFELQGNLIYEQ